MDKLLSALSEKKHLLSATEVRILCRKVFEILIEEPNVLTLNGPIVVVGNLMGQFVDFLEIFNKIGQAPEKQFLFLGNYIDRGKNSCAIIEYLLILKLCFPTRVWLLRGNHECRQITLIYGFHDEILNRYGSQEIWRDFCAVFDLLPLAATIGKEAFCVHSGLSPSISKISEINLLERGAELPYEGPIIDLLWSMPENRKGWGLIPRSAGYEFGEDVMRDFHCLNDTSLIVRSNSLCMEGFEYYFSKQLLSIFSAPDYCYRCDNKGAVVIISEKEPSIIQFQAVANKSEKGIYPLQLLHVQLLNFINNSKCIFIRIQYIFCDLLKYYNFLLFYVYYNETQFIMNNLLKLYECST